MYIYIYMNTHIYFSLPDWKLIVNKPGAPQEEDRVCFHSPEVAEGLPCDCKSATKGSLIPEMFASSEPRSRPEASANTLVLPLSLQLQ